MVNKSELDPKPLLIYDFDICMPICGANFMYMLKRTFQVHILIDFSNSNKKDIKLFLGHHFQK